MANLFVVWDIKNRRPVSIHETNGAAVTELRNYVSKTGATANEKHEPQPASAFEVITVTR